MNNINYYNPNNFLPVKMTTLEKKSESVREIYKNTSIKCNDNKQLSSKCGQDQYCSLTRFCNSNNECVNYNEKDNNSKHNSYRLCNHPNDKNCIPSKACYSNGICSTI